MASFNNVSETTLSGCYEDSNGNSYWTAGQRIDPSRESTFVWRTSNTYTTVTGMTYTNWNRGEPNYDRQNEACMCLWSGQSYRWNDGRCSFAACFVCELDMAQ